MEAIGNIVGLQVLLNLWRICLQCRRPGFNPWIRKIPWRRAWQPTPVFLPGEFPGQTSPAGYSLWSCKETWVKQLTYTHTLITLVLDLLQIKGELCKLHDPDPLESDFTAILYISIAAWRYCRFDSRSLAVS